MSMVFAAIGGFLLGGLGVFLWILWAFKDVYE